MNNGIFIIAHAPLASALRQCVAHVFPERVDGVMAFDIQPDVPIQESVAAVERAVAGLAPASVLLLTDVMGATPCNVARQLLGRLPARLVAGVNLPMLLRAVTYQDQTLDELTARAVSGGSQGVVQVAAST
jgi:PTS system ascorbate-specific IIA component